MSAKAAARWIPFSNGTESELWFLWSDLFWERSDEDRAALEEVRDAAS